MTKYACSPWVTEFPGSRVPAYPRQRGETRSDVVVVGGGLTGCATAYAFAVAGIEVTLVEASRIGRGASGSSTGWIADDPGVDFTEVAGALGTKAARGAWQLWRRAALDFSALVRRLDLKCHLEPHGSLLVASTAEQAARLQRERKARVDAGFDTSIVNSKVASAESGTTSTGAIRSKDGALLDPYRATLGLAAAAKNRGVKIFEGSPVKRITFNRRSADLYTQSGLIHTNRVVVATGLPTSLFQSLARHFWFKTSFLALTERVPAALRRQLRAEGMVVRDAAQPPHIVHWVGGDRLLVAGADLDGLEPRQREKTIVQRTGQLMYELSVLYPDISGIQPQYGWDVPYAKTADGLPFIGPHRNYPHHLFAWGGPSQTVTGAYLASRMLLRHHLGEIDSADEVFGFRLEKRS